MSKDKKTVSAEVIEKIGGVEQLRRIELPLDDDGNKFLEVIACVPDRRTMGQYLKYQNVNPAKAQEILVKNCLLTDKDQVMADDALFLTCVSELAGLVPIREGKIKKVLDDCPGLIDDDDKDMVFKIDAMISHILHLPFPEQLSDETWAHKWAQVQWLVEKGIVAPKIPV